MLLSDRLDCWLYVPALFSCLVHEMIPSVKSFDPERSIFSNGMHQIVYTLNSIALALESAFQSRYFPNSLSFERNGRVARMDCVWDSLPKKVSIFSLRNVSLCLPFIQKRNQQRFLTRLSITQNQIPILLRCLLLQGLCGDVLSMAQLEDIGISSTRSASALVTASKKHLDSQRRIAH